jgi:LPS export ABC transporter protein LptC
LRQRVTHFPEDDRAELAQPDFVSFDNDAWQVGARTGTLVRDTQRDEDRLDLAGDVKLRKPLSNGDVVEVDTSELTVFIDTEEAYSEAPVELRTRSSRLNGIGMQARLAQNIVKVNDGNGTHVPATKP